MSTPSICVAAFYHFARLADYRQLRRPLLERMLGLDVKGSVLLANEGINGTLSGTPEAVGRLLGWLTGDQRLAGLTAKYSIAASHPFLRSKVKLKREIVTMGVADLPFCPGSYVSPKDWNRLITSPDVLLVDTRNDYEYAIGTFAGAVNPQLDNFRQFPGYWQGQCKRSMEQRGATKLAMFCTGGIRCEKATSLARQSGMDDVYHLKGGILAYLAQIPSDESLWQGECFVFDNRVALGHGLAQGSYAQCHACRYPISQEDMRHPDYQPGVQCPRCAGQRNARQQQRATERQRQQQLASQHGRQHLATNLAEAKQRKQHSRAKAVAWSQAGC